MTLKKTANLLLILLTAAAISGCTNTFTTAPAETQPAPATQTTSQSTGAQAGETQSTQPATQKTTAVYYDFEDVLIPLELSIVQDRTVVVSTPGFTSGIIVLKGRVERRSLINFFNNNMQKDNWTIVSQIKSPGNSILVFEKASRCAVITIKNEQFNTWVEVGVAARMDEDAVLSGGVKNSEYTESDLTE